MKTYLTFLRLLRQIVFRLTIAVALILSTGIVHSQPVLNVTPLTTTCATACNAEVLLFMTGGIMTAGHFQEYANQSVAAAGLNKWIEFRIVLNFLGGVNYYVRNYTADMQFKLKDKPAGEKRVIEI